MVWQVEGGRLITRHQQMGRVMFLDRRESREIAVSSLSSSDLPPIGGWTGGDSHPYSGPPIRLADHYRLSGRSTPEGESHVQQETAHLAAGQRRELLRTKEGPRCSA